MPILNAVATVSKPYFEQEHDFVLFSYHGLPENQITKLDKSKQYCLKKENCCDEVCEINQDCYRAHCFATTRELVKKLGIEEGRYASSFQSRLGKTPWIKPYTDKLYETLPKQGVKRMLVMCPSFVADCLETIEEIGIRGKEDFQKFGGKDLKLVPSLNSENVWANAVYQMALELDGNNHKFKEGDPVKVKIPKSESGGTQLLYAHKIAVVDSIHSINDKTHYSVIYDIAAKKGNSTYFLVSEDQLEAISKNEFV